MAKLPELPILPSLVDRLIDREPQNGVEAVGARTQSFQELKDSVRRDLEWLLNTRRPPVAPPASARELSRSVYAYGLPDTTGLAASSDEDRRQMAHLVETAIAAFEPRLQNVAVTLTPAPADHRVLHFQIAALLRTEPAPAQVYFDTTLELTSGEYEIKGETRAR
jgi:type VI secretion system protein ImpF